MSGIKTTEKESFNDLPFERYDKCAQVGKKYSLIQAGICIIHKEGDQYICYPFNAYVIRRKIEGTQYKPDIMLESGAIRFNAEHGVDFDQWIKKGISFLDREQYMNLTQEVNNRQNLSNQERNTILNNIEEALGFTRFFELVAQRNVPIVGHNCYMDLMFLHNSFIGQLPKFYSKKFSIEEESEESNEDNDSLSEEKKENNNNAFKENLHSLFKKIYDSKAISVSFFKEYMTEDNKSTSLEKLKEFIYTDLEKYRLANVKLAPSYEDYDWDVPSNTQKFHEAGFDSYLTGWMFLQLREFYVKNLNKTYQDFENTYLNNINVMNNRFFLSLGSDNDINQTQILNNLVSEDLVGICTHQDHNDLNKEVDQEAMEKLCKQILEHFLNQMYLQYVRVSISNQKFIIIELSLSNNRDQSQIDILRKKFEDDLQVINQMANVISFKEYENQVFQKKYSRNNNKKSNNTHSNNNSKGNNQKYSKKKY